MGRSDPSWFTRAVDGLRDSSRGVPPAARVEPRGWATQETTGIRTTALLTVLATETLHTALAITGADLGFVQVVDAATGALVIVARSGFGPETVAYFDAVGADAASSSGRALRRCAQVVIRDVDLDTGFRPHRAAAAAAGFRAVQSTPLVDPDDTVVGVVSTHFRRPHRPPEQQLRSLLSGGRLAGAALAPLLAAHLVTVDELADLRATVAQLERALTSRIVIEQAKGVISVVNRVDVDRAFEILRGYARSHHARIHEVAAAVVNAGLRP